MHFSLIVATLGRPDELQRLARSIEQQSEECELIVVDQSDGDAVTQILQTLRIPVIHLHTEVRNTSRARNLGIQVATGEVLAFPDDDCAYPGGLLSAVREALEKGQNLVSGQYVDWDGTRSYFPQEPASISGLTAYDRVSAITFFVRNQGEMNVLFDERLGGGGELSWSEEIDYAMRYTAQFGAGSYDPSLMVFHAVRRASIDNPAAREGMRRAQGYILTKNWRLLGRPGLLRLLRAGLRDILHFPQQRRLPVVQGAFAGLKAL